MSNDIPNEFPVAVQRFMEMVGDKEYDSQNEMLEDAKKHALVFDAHAPRLKDDTLQPEIQLLDKNNCPIGSGICCECKYFMESFPDGGFIFSYSIFPIVCVQNLEE